MASPELIKQVAEELKEIQNAPPIMYGPTIPRCHFCGTIVSSHEDLTPVNGPVHPQTGNPVGEQRFLGKCCGG